MIPAPKKAGERAREKELHCKLRKESAEENGGEKARLKGEESRKKARCRNGGSASQDERGSLIGAADTRQDCKEGYFYGRNRDCAHGQHDRRDAAAVQEH